MASVQSVAPYLLPGVSVVHPPHLEGDPSLATEILPGPPSLLSIQQVGLPRRDHKKTAVACSYLPTSDPGTTYTGHLVSTVTTTAPAEMDGSRRKRARLDKGATGTSRSQRASARNLAAAATSSEPPVMFPEMLASSSQLVPDSDPPTVPMASDDTLLSRSNSLITTEEPVPAPPARRKRGRPRKDKGKEKEREKVKELDKEAAVIRVKEEPTTILLNSSDSLPSLPNEDHCSSCRSLGSLVYCDGCPKAFHLWCLDPPMEAVDLPAGDARWFCPACMIHKRPQSRHPATSKFMAPLIHELETRIPVEYQLPLDIRTTFKDVATGPRGAYVDSSEIKPPRLNRHGQLEDRDPYRLKDRNGDPVLCFRCGTSALPPGLAAAAPAAKRARRGSDVATESANGRSIISCDYCHLHWHLDCLEPPLAYMPPWGRKWMCPNHAESVLQPKRRVPRANATPIEITKLHQFNNGNIEVVQADSGATTPVIPNKMAVDEVLINGRRYRVPERVIVLDFWNKLGRKSHVQAEMEPDSISGMSSPLTSLSSLDDSDGIPPFTPQPAVYSMEDVKLAQTLCGLLMSGSSLGNVRGSHDLPSDSNKAMAIRQTQLNGVAVREAEAEGHINGAAKPSPKRLLPSAKAPAGVGIDVSRTGRSAVPRQRDPMKSHSSKKPLRLVDDDVPMDVDTEVAPSRGRRPSRRGAPKNNSTESITTPLESRSNGFAVDDQANSASGSASEQKPTEAPTSSVLARPKRTRQSARRNIPPLAPAGSAMVPLGSEGDPQESATTLPEQPGLLSRVRVVSGARKRAAATRKEPISRVSNQRPSTPPPPTKKVAVAATTTSGPSVVKTEQTPTLKIRLPRLAPLPSTSASSSAVVEAAPIMPLSRSNDSKPQSRPRRPRRGRPSRLNSTPYSSEAGSSSKFNDAAPSTSPIESF